jgi:type I restriction enzyme R subunit
MAAPGGHIPLASANFAFLEQHDPQLVRLAGLAERYFPSDPNGCLVKLRMFGELLATLLAARYGVLVADESQTERLRRFRETDAVPREILTLFHGLRQAGNEAVHAFADEHSAALSR